MMSYRDLLQFYVAQTKWPAGAPTPALPYDDLRLFYQIHVGRPLTPLPPALPPPSIENIGAFITDEEVVTKDKATATFASVQESFASVGEEQTKMKEGLHGLASKIDEVQGKAAEDLDGTSVRKLAECVFRMPALTRAIVPSADVMSDMERQQAAAKVARRTGTGGDEVTPRSRKRLMRNMGNRQQELPHMHSLKRIYSRPPLCRLGRWRNAQRHKLRRR